MKQRFALLLLLGAFSSPALALGFNGGYAGLGYVATSIAPDHASDKANTGALQFSFGGWLNQSNTLGVEGRIGLGIQDGNVHYNSVGERNVSIDRYYGAYFRAQFPNTLPVRPYGLIGVTRVETDEMDGAHDHHGENYDDISLGLGADFTITRDIFISLEYMRVADHGGDQINQVALGVNGRF